MLNIVFKYQMIKIMYFENLLYKSNSRRANLINT